MRQDVLVPRVSETTEEGILVTWFVEPGATVREGDLVAEVQVEKLSAEVRASAGGRIELLAEPGDVIVQGHPIAVIETALEPAEAAPPQAAALARPGVAVAMAPAARSCPRRRPPGVLPASWGSSWPRSPAQAPRAGSSRRTCRRPRAVADRARSWSP